MSVDVIFWALKPQRGRRSVRQPRNASLPVARNVPPSKATGAARFVVSAMEDILDVWRDMTGRAPVTRSPPRAKRDILSRKALPRSQRICVLCCCSRRLRDGVAERCLQLLLAVRAVFCDGASAVLMHQRDAQGSPASSAEVQGGFVEMVVSHYRLLQLLPEASFSAKRREILVKS